MKAPFKLFDELVKRGDLLFAIALLGIVFILVLPLPPLLIDLFLTISITMSVLIILTVAYVKHPIDFYVFPSVLLFVTLFRLGLNIATTRSILTNANAGHLIDAFGQFVVQGNVIVGLILFLILTAINFIVITKGAGRVAEVSARFTLDAMPGKQMSIDADLNSGVISEKEARERRSLLEREASFYGAMDGASKFVRGDAIAGIIITVVNLMGGFAVGILQMGKSAQESAETFTLLSVGDGLVTQIPALVVSTAAGILVTRSSARAGLGEEVARQMFASAHAIRITGILLWLLMFVPGFPVPVLFSLGGILIAASLFLPKQESELEKQEREKVEKAKTDAQKAPGKDEFNLKVEPLCLELGLNLLPLVQGNMRNLLDRLSALRRALSIEFGVYVPPITVRDNSVLPPHRYRVLLHGHEIAGADLFPGQLLAMGVGTNQRPLRGQVTKEPAFGLPATWIVEKDKKDAERMGFAVVDPLSVLVTHFSEIIKANIAELLCRQDVQKLIDQNKETNGAVIQEMTNLQISLGVVHRVLQNLLREGLSVREFAQIIEKITDHFIHSKHPDELSEFVRKGLSLEIVRHCELQEGRLPVLALHPELEQLLAKGIRQTQHEMMLVLDPAVSQHIHTEITRGIETLARTGASPVLLCSAPIRLGLYRYFCDAFQNLKVIAYQELPPKMLIHAVYTVQMPTMAKAA